MNWNNMNQDAFDSSWRDICTISHASAEQLRPMVKAHYLGKWPAIQMCKIGMWAGPFIVGMVIFSMPPKETKIRYGGETWELARLWIHDEVPRNAETWLIAQAVKHIRKEHPRVKYLISYADPSAGHRGTIYKAANWIADGRTDDERKTPRCDYMNPKTGITYGRKGHIPAGVNAVRVPRVSKFRYRYEI